MWLKRVISQGKTTYVWNKSQLKSGKYLVKTLSERLMSVEFWEKCELQIKKTFLFSEFSEFITELDCKCVSMNYCRELLM